MSAAVLPQQDHRVTHSPHEAPNQRYYQPIAPSRGPIYGQQRSPPMATSSPRPSSGAEQYAAPSRPQHDSRDASVSQQQAHSGAFLSTSPTGSRSSDSRAPLPASMPEIKTERLMSPDAPPPSARKRPHKLDLDTSIPSVMGNGSGSGGAQTAKESGSLSSMQEVATACLSPGFDTTDPKVRQQMERSREMAEQQRAIIAQRQMKSGGRGAESSGSKPADYGPPPSATFSKPTAAAPRKKAPPSNISIAAAGAYGNEPRVIQSAPINQTFTGLNRHPHPLSRQVFEHSHQHALGYGQHNPRQPEQHQYGQASTPQSTRLPPLADVFAAEGLPSPRPDHGIHRSNSGPESANQNGPPRPLFAPLSNGVDHRGHSKSANPSPIRPPHYDPLHANDFARQPSNHESFLRSTAVSHPSQQQLASPPDRDRDYRSAEEAMHSMVGGRTELLPKAIHYGGRQPPTPSSPHHPHHHSSPSDRRPYESTTNGLKIETDGRPERRRTRDEFERDMPDAAADQIERDRQHERRRAEENASTAAGLGFGFGFGELRNDAREGRPARSPETMRRRKDEFMSICSRAWDLLQDAD